MLRVAQLLLSLAILVIFHEFGHFLFAKIFKTRVEKFYLFFNPWFSLFKFKKGETQYGIGWLPLGGYVKIAGMIDESMDKEQMKQPPQPWEFRSKPAWQRLLIMLGGVMVNVILAFIIYIAILFVWGEKYISVDEVNKHGIFVDSLGREIGLRDGDLIVSVNDEVLTDYDDVIKNLLLNNPHKLTVNRQGKDTSVIITNEIISGIIKNGFIFEPRIPFIIEEIPDTSVAKNAGMLPYDKIIAINNEPVSYFQEIKPKLDENKSKKIDLTIIREQSDTVYLSLILPETGKLGVIVQTIKLDTTNYSFFAAIPAGLSKTVEEVGLYLKQLKLVFTPKTKAYKSVGSFISITKLFPKKWNWEIFWSLTALLSVMLAVLNLLPIPALDGGHVMFTLYEMIVGKKPSDKFLEKAQLVGMVILLALIVYALGNDFINHIF